MSSTNSEEHNDSWAVQLFRPVLKDLNIQNLDNQTYLFSSNYRALHRFHMDRCIVVVKKFHFSKDNYKGVFIWRYLKKQNVFLLYIILSDSMYRNDLSKDEKIYRKAVTTHEFIHCEECTRCSDFLKGLAEGRKEAEEKMKCGGKLSRIMGWNGVVNLCNGCYGVDRGKGWRSRK